MINLMIFTIAMFKISGDAQIHNAVSNKSLQTESLAHGIIKESKTQQQTRQNSITEEFSK